MPGSATDRCQRRWELNILDLVFVADMFSDVAAAKALNESGETVVSGVYFYHLSASDYSATRKMLILK